LDKGTEEFSETVPADPVRRRRAAQRAFAITSNRIRSTRKLTIKQTVSKTM